MNEPVSIFEQSKDEIRTDNKQVDIPTCLPLVFPTPYLPRQVQTDLGFAYLYLYRAYRIVGQTPEQSLAALQSKYLVLSTDVQSRLIALANRTWGHEWLSVEADLPQASV